MARLIEAAQAAWQPRSTSLIAWIPVLPCTAAGTQRLDSAAVCPSHLLDPMVCQSAEPEAHRIVDFWLLMALLTLGTERKKAAEAVLQ